MMSLDYIRELSREAAEEAEELGKQPYVFDKDGVTVDNLGNIPNLGTLLPTGWVRVSLKKEDESRGVYMGDNEGYGAYFVDSSGFSGPGEPALSIGEFLDVIKPGLGYGIVEVGQFQIKIAAFAVRTDG